MASLATTLGRAIDRGTLTYTDLRLSHDHRGEVLQATRPLGQDDPVAIWLRKLCHLSSIAPVIQRREFARHQSSNIGRSDRRRAEHLRDELTFGVNLDDDREGFGRHLSWRELVPHEHVAKNAYTTPAYAISGRVFWKCGTGCRVLTHTEAKALGLPTYTSAAKP